MDAVLVPQEITRLYEDYLAEIARLEAERKPTDGLMGFGRSPGSDPCHERFASALKEELLRLGSLPVSPEEAEAILRWVFEAPQQQMPSSLAAWMFQAVHGLAAPLLPLLSREQTEALSDWYEDTYPRRTRLPVQQETVKALRTQAGKPKEPLLKRRKKS